MHIIPKNSIWCEKYGMIVCFAFLGGTKAFLYGVFLFRARHVLIQQFNKTKFKLVIFDKVLPAYITIYYFTYCTVTTLFFRMKYYDLTVDSSQISWCAFADWGLWFVTAASILDLINSVVATIVFAVPLCKLMKLADRKDVELVSAIKYDATLTFIASITSAITLV
eukprot:UN08421